MLEDPTVAVTTFGYPAGLVLPVNASKTICVIEDPDGVVVMDIEFAVLVLKVKALNDIASDPFSVFVPKGREVGVSPVLFAPL